MPSWFATGPMVRYRPDAATVLVHPMRPRERVGVSPATLGRHATNPHNAGLMTTVRTGIAVLHSLTPLGRALLGS